MPRSLSSPKVSFKYEKVPSQLFGSIYRPVVDVQLWSAATKSWKSVQMLVDTGADYTILPRYLATWLELDVKDKGTEHETVGVGGLQKIYVVPNLKVRIGTFEREVPVGIINSTKVPPLMGRQGFFETFNVLFQSQHRLEFSE